MRLPQIQKLQASNMARPGWGRTSNQRVLPWRREALEQPYPSGYGHKARNTCFAQHEIQMPGLNLLPTFCSGPLRCLCPSRNASKSFHILSTNNRNTLPLLRTNITTVLIDRFGESATLNPLIEHLIIRLSGLSLEPVMTCRYS